MKNNPIKERSYRFALSIIKLYKRVQVTNEYIISKQLLRSGTSIGANIEEATAAKVKKISYIKCPLLQKKLVKRYIG